MLHSINSSYPCFSLQRLKTLLFLLCVCTGSIFLSACSFTINHNQLFQLRDAQVPVASLELTEHLDRSKISPISLNLSGRNFQGYQFREKNPTRAILFFAGSGYGAPSAIGRMASNFADGQTDIYILSYGERNESAPEIAQVHAMSITLAQMAQSNSGIPADKITVIGHSFGAWISMNLASQQKIGCTVVVGAATNVIETSYSILPKFVASFWTLKVPDDVALLDNLSLAKHVTQPTLVVVSKGDWMTPVSFSQRIYDQLIASKQKTMFISEKITHNAYFRDADVNQKIREFMNQECAGHY